MPRLLECVLDTSAVIDLMRGRDEPAMILAEFERPVIPHVVLGELLLGALKSNQPEKESEKIVQAFDRVTVLGADPRTADFYAAIRF
jgi:tRNA(fMet)-specific endonuclease VapC